MITSVTSTSVTTPAQTADGSRDIGDAANRMSEDLD
jgi:hypothetical protein